MQRFLIMRDFELKRCRFGGFCSDLLIRSSGEKYTRLFFTHFSWGQSAHVGYIFRSASVTLPIAQPF